MATGPPDGNESVVREKVVSLINGVNSPGACPMHLRTLRIYHRFSDVGEPIRRSTIHYRCNLFP